MARIIDLDKVKAGVTREADSSGTVISGEPVCLSGDTPSGSDGFCVVDYICTGPDGICILDYACGPGEQDSACGIDMACGSQTLP